MGIPSSFSRCLSVLLVIIPSLVNARGTLHKEGFIEELVASQRGFTGAFIPNPTDESLPPMLLIASKPGIVHILRDPDNSIATEVVLDISANLCTNGERGMQAITPHPNFSQNYYLYIYYTLLREGCLEDPEFGPYNRLSRFTMDPSTLKIMPESEEVLLDGHPTYKFFHNGGAVKFGNDGKLYVTTGDGGGDAFGTSQDLTNLLGVMMRLNDDGSIPEDNPFTQQAGYNGVPCGQSLGKLPDGSPADAVCSEIFSYGLRNPFRLVMNPAVTNKTHFYINDVGGAVWEDISEGGTDFAGMNYGWPTFEGPCRFGRTDACPLYASDAALSIQDYNNQVKPLYYYEHRSEREGGCISGGAFVPPGIWPPEYKFMYADFIFQEIYNLVEAPDQECTTCLPPIPAFVNDTFYTSILNENDHVNVARIVDMFFGPYKDTQALYIFKMGGSDNVWRIRYTGSTNLPPVAKIGVDDQFVDEGAIVSFNGSLSFDPAGDDLAFEWDFGDGSFSKEKSPIHVYSESGQYTVRLVVTDSAGQEQSDSLIMVVGTPPTLNITNPPEGAQFFVGELFTLSGVAFDSTGAPLNDTQISWEVRQHHADHWHPFLDQTAGNNLQISPAPEPEDYHAATNSYLAIIMYATDSNGLVSETVRYVYPRTIEVCIDSEPQGLEVYVDEYPIITPLLITSWVNHDLRLRIAAQEGFSFYSWNDAVILDDREIRLQSSGNPGMLAIFCSDGNNTCIDEAEARASESLLVARCPTKAPTEAPTALVSDSPTMLHSSAPSFAPSDDEEEEWPVDEVEINANGEPIPERPHDFDGVPEDDPVWDRFDQDAAITVIPSLAALSILCILLNAVQLLALH
ncbi:PKD domain containing protein [Nitzschia inconspicua]|uniref:PKD domain containing protein n=1 Tax=Nitzschia inconspicua TaxID=303405 RepID=A0A9K3LQ08_9STRA|nr:PKD domain containing protein [Nitzschia inconspicua]